MPDSCLSSVTRSSPSAIGSRDEARKISEIRGFVERVFQLFFRVLSPFGESRQTPPSVVIIPYFFPPTIFFSAFFPIVVMATRKTHRHPVVPISLMRDVAEGSSLPFLVLLPPTPPVSSSPHSFLSPSPHPRRSHPRTHHAPSIRTTFPAKL